MSTLEIVRSALRGMNANKLRSVLTLLGVLIGVGSVILLVGVGQGSATAVADQIGALGSSTLTVRSGGVSSGALRYQNLTTTVSDALTTASQDGTAPSIDAVVPEVSTSGTVTYGTESTSATVIGTTASYFEATTADVAQGTGFTQNDVDTSRRVVVIGSELAETLFGTADPVGQSIVIGSTPYYVDGVLQTQDSSGIESSNSNVIMPITRAQQSISGYGDLSAILLKATSDDTVDTAKAEAASVLNSVFKLSSSSDASYTISSQTQLLSTQESTTSTFAAMLTAVACLSLIVGGIGVTNIMLVTVTERTREIGIRKALGATRGAILGQFLVEATLLSLLGGLLGVVAALIGSRFSILGIEPQIVGSSVVLALGVSIGIGVFFGGYPAARASRLRPVEALRHE